MPKFKNKECKLCFFRGEDKCYELSYTDGVFTEPKFMNVDEYFDNGCKKMRLNKIKKIINVKK